MSSPAHLTPTEVRRLLDEHGLAPRRSAGQNFVVDANTVDKIVASAGLAADDAVLEIGPGLGSLTVGLLRAVRRVVAVEVDAGLVAVLADRLGDHPALELHHADALEVDYASLSDEPLRLVANLPYSQATALLLDALASPAVRDALVMVQREVGERWAASPGDDAYGAPTVRLALQADVNVAFAVPRTVFYPAPHVDSVMVRVTRRPDAPDRDELARIDRVVDAAFGQRRKTLRNSLSRLADKPAVVAACDRAGVDASRRAERLTPVDFRRLTGALAGAG